jgi:hypothetical protein
MCGRARVLASDGPCRYTDRGACRGYGAMRLPCGTAGYYWVLHAMVQKMQATQSGLELKLQQMSAGAVRSRTRTRTRALTRARAQASAKSIIEELECSICCDNFTEACTLECRSGARVAVARRGQQTRVQNATLVRGKWCLAHKRAPDARSRTHSRVHCGCPHVPLLPLSRSFHSSLSPVRANSTCPLAHA